MSMEANNMSVWKLMREHQQNYPESHFFDKETLRFFGERISEMRVLKNVIRINDFYGNAHTCYVLSSLQRNNPAGASRKHHYFDVETFEVITT